MPLERATLPQLMLLRLSAALLLATLFSGCEDIPDAPGVYFGHYAGGATECIEIRPDHTYRQVLIHGGKVVYDNSGTWKERTDRNKGPLFNDFISAGRWGNEPKRREELIVSPEKLSGVGALSDWDPVSREKVLLPGGEATYLSTDKNSPIKSAEQFMAEHASPRR